MRFPDIDYLQYARLLIKTAVGLKPGGKLRIRFHIGGALLARCCAEVAYKEGAAIVDFQFQDTYVQKARIINQQKDLQALGVVPGWIDAWQDSFLDESWAYLCLESFEDIGVMNGVDPSALADFERLQRVSIAKFREALISHNFNWCICGVPGDAWAERVLGSGKKAEDLWAVLQHILLLDQDDPDRAWKDKIAKLTERKQKLNEMELDSLHFEDEGTDLTVGLLRKSIWCGGGQNDGKNLHMPNIPTEEVFTTPDFKRSEGKVKTTRPVEIQGTLVKDVQIVFRDGQVMNFSAGEGAQNLEAFLQVDDGASLMGEIALVGQDSLVAQSGHVFDSILFDENASCHFALGSGYTTCVSDGHLLDSPQAKKQAGCNYSIVHKDFMIGSSETCVTGRDRNGKSVPIIRNGIFVI